MTRLLADEGPKLVQFQPRARQVDHGIVHEGLAALANASEERPDRLAVNARHARRAAQRAPLRKSGDDGDLLRPGEHVRHVNYCTTNIR